MFGRDWLHKIQLDWKRICPISKEQPTQDTQKKLERLIDYYSEVFKDEIGTCKSAKVKLALKEGSQPKFFKARPVLYAMKPKVEVELKRLEKEGILRKVKFSDWATPIVPVAKSNHEIHAVVNAPRPENVQQLRSFLGLVNYYHKFLPNLATTLNPLNGLLEQGNDGSGPQSAKKAFHSVKKQKGTTPKLIKKP